MIALPAGVKVWLAAGTTDMRKGFDGLAALVQTHLEEDPFSGQLFVFRGRAGDRVKVLWWSGDGLCLFAAGDARYGEFKRRAALDVVGRDRLAARRAHLRAAARGVKVPIFTAFYAACDERTRYNALCLKRRICRTTSKT